MAHGDDGDGSDVGDDDGGGDILSSLHNTCMMVIVMTDDECKTKCSVSNAPYTYEWRGFKQNHGDSLEQFRLLMYAVENRKDGEMNKSMVQQFSVSKLRQKSVSSAFFYLFVNLATQLLLFEKMWNRTAMCLGRLRTQVTMYIYSTLV